MKMFYFLQIIARVTMTMSNVAMAFVSLKKRNAMVISTVETNQTKMTVQELRVICLNLDVPMARSA